MQKWQNENQEQRAVFCVTSDEESFRGIFHGITLPIVAALANLAESNEAYKKLLEAVNQAISDPIGKMLVYTKWEEYKKEHGFKNCNDDENEAPDKSSGKSFLKDLFQTLADKL